MAKWRWLEAVSWVPTALVHLCAWLLTPIWADRCSLAGLGCGLSFPSPPKVLATCKEAVRLLRDIEAQGSEITLKTILGLCSLSPTSSNPDSPRPLFQCPCEPFWDSLFLLVMWVKPRMTLLDDFHLRPPQTLLLELGKAKEKLPHQGLQDEVSSQP